jgi:hypothetical protein
MNDKTASGRPERGDAPGKLLGTPSRIIALEQQVRQLAGDDSRLPETGPGAWLS